MAKATTLFFCTACGFELAKWQGCCPSCGEWNTVEEAPKSVVTKAKANKKTANGSRSWLLGATNAIEAIELESVTSEMSHRQPTGESELDRALGGGLVTGSMTLIGGDPGIGKSTLLLQAMANIAQKTNVLYVTGEESGSQIKLRAERLKLSGKNIKLLAATDLATICQTIETERPAVVVIDSIQTICDDAITSAPGTVTQVREATATLLKLAKSQGVSIILVGHVTKEGSLAGPRILEHMVDTVLYFEGEQTTSVRILRAVKNRFGATDEVGFFEMTGSGLKSVTNASAWLMSGRPQHVSGSGLTVAFEGTRPLLLELQALLVPTAFPSPIRTAQGVDRMRLSMLLAVMTKHFKQPLNQHDVYLNVVGGVRINEPSSDLAIMAAIMSSLREKPLADNVVLLGEIGLVGEVRAIPQIERRINEGVRMGYCKYILPASHKRTVDLKATATEADLVFVSNINEAMDLLFP